MNEYTWKLSDPGMDLLERAGLAGLHMALTAATEAKKDLSPLAWSDADLTADSVTVRWDGPPKPAFQKLIEWAWQVRDGVLYFPAVHDARDLAYWWNRVAIHKGIMRTFLQHPQVQPKLDAVTRIIQVEEDKQIKVVFEPPAERVDDPNRPVNPKTKRLHKKKVASKCVKPHDDIDGLFTDRDQFKRPMVSLASWISPGVARRYGDEKSWVGRAERAVLLMFALTVCGYLKLPQSKVKVKSKQVWIDNWVAIVPDVRNIAEFAEARPRLPFRPEFTDISSLGDAGLRFASEFSTLGARRELSVGCQVIVMGKVGYYPNQSVRKAVFDIPPVPICSLRRYRLLQAVFPHYFRTYQLPPATEADGELSQHLRGRYVLPTGRGRVADNLVSGRPWYRDLFVPLSWDDKKLDNLRRQYPGYSAERLWFTALIRQRDKLMALVDSPSMWDDPRDRTFVEAFWQTLRSLYRQEAKAVAERGGSRSVKERWKHLIEEVRRKLMEARTQRTSRAALAELFARAGTQPELATHTPTIWRLMDHPEHWERGRDLALLALVSYRSKKKQTEGQPAATQGA